MSATEDFKQALVGDMVKASIHGAEQTFEEVIKMLEMFSEHRAVEIVRAMLTGFRQGMSDAD
jgi:hypothetical protein